MSEKQPHWGAFVSANHLLKWLPHTFWWNSVGLMNWSIDYFLTNTIAERKLIIAFFSTLWVTQKNHFKLSDDILLILYVAVTFPKNTSHVQNSHFLIHIASISIFFFEHHLRWFCCQFRFRWNFLYLFFHIISPFLP